MFTEYKISAADINARSIEIARTLSTSAPGRNPAQFAAQTIAERLRKAPAKYLEFGPYWWSVKRALGALGYDLGRQDDAIIRAEYGGDLHDFAALVVGEMFKDEYRATWFVGNAQFWLDADTAESYVLFDLDMQSRVLGQDVATLDGAIEEEATTEGGEVLDSVDASVPSTPFRVEFERAGELWTADLYATGIDEARGRVGRLDRAGLLDSVIDKGRDLAGAQVIDLQAELACHVDMAGRRIFEVARFGNQTRSDET